MNRLTTALLLLAACAPHAQPQPTVVPVATPVATAPASKDPVFLECVVIEKKWVAKYAETDASDAAKRLGASVEEKLHLVPDNARAAVADAVLAVLGESAMADPDRPKSLVIPYDGTKRAWRISDGVKKQVEAFAAHARPGDFLDPPAADDDTVVVARAIAH